MAKTQYPVRFESGDDPAVETTIKKPRLCGSARLTYTILAFLSMVVQLCLRNTLNIVILYMVKRQNVNNNTRTAYYNEECGPPIIDTSDEKRTGTLPWTRSQEFTILSAFYVGYLVTLPIAGMLSDKFGGKLLFIHSITVQAVVFMLIPVFAEISFVAAVIIRVIQGLIAGCGNPALYQLFSVWAHPSERTALLSIAYGGFSVGSLIVFPIASFLASYGWSLAFYVIGAVSLIFGICCQWLVYSTLEDHPRLSKEEFDYLKSSQLERAKGKVPWKSILTSVPVYAFIFTHAFHIYGIMVFTLLIPKFFEEAMRLPLHQVALASTVPFLGSFVSKAVTIFSCSYIEQRPGLNLTRFRRILYVLCNLATILLILGIIFCTCQQIILVMVYSFAIGISTDLGFAGAYWPSLLYVSPAFAGLICGIANCFATLSGALAPVGISYIVHHGAKEEWNRVLCTLIGSYVMGAAVYGLFGSSKLAAWGNGIKNNTNNNNAAEL